MSWTHRSARFDAEIVLLVVVAKRLHFSRKLVEIHTDVRVFVPPSPPAEVEDYQLRGGARNDAEPVKHVPQTRQRKRAAAGGAAGPRALLFTSLHHSSRQVDQVSPAHGFCGEERPGEPPGEKRPRGLHRQQHAVCVRRLPGECASPAQVCAADATASLHCLSSVLINISAAAERPGCPQSPCFCFSRLTFLTWIRVRWIKSTVFRKSKKKKQQRKT